VFSPKIYIEGDADNNPIEDCLNQQAIEFNLGPYFIICCFRHRNEYVENGTFIRK